MEITAFKSWLQSKSYSDATIRNYLVDVNKYLEYSSTHQNDIFDFENLSLYLESIKNDSNYSRYSSSLSKFFQFALDQHLISENIFNKALKNTGEPVYPSLGNIIKTYQKHLEDKKFSISTIRNYINDIQQFINWAQSSKFNDQLPISNDKNLKIIRN